MAHRTKRALQTAIVLAAATLGAVCALRLDSDALDRACTLALVVLAVVGVFLEDIASLLVRPGAENGALPGLAATKQQFAGAMAIIAKLIETHLDANAEFSDTLGQANRELSAPGRPDKVRTVVTMLMAENNKMRTKLGRLSQRLETKRAEIATLRSSLAEANEISLRDPLTMLGNRRFFDTMLARQITEAHAEETGMCLALADIDEFKRINDSFGHQVGDSVIKLFAEFLARKVGDRDMVARYGGEEFAIIFPAKVLREAMLIVDAIRSELAAKEWRVNTNGERIGKITASFGIAQLLSEEAPQDLVRRVDAKLYEAKAAGRNRVVIDLAA